MAILEVFIEGDKELLAKLEDIDAHLLDKSVFDTIGFYLLTKIKARTLKGKDVRGKLFKAYDPSYKLFRIKKNRQGSPVNLSFTGSMLASMTFTSKDDQVNVFFLPTEDQYGGKNPVKAFFLNKDRRFFALSRDEVEGVVGIMHKHIQRLLEQ